MIKHYKHLLLLFVLSTLVFSCKKDPIVVPDNTAPYYAGVPKVKIENYINRIFIDLIGREALDVELAAELANFQAAELSAAVREQLIIKLQTNDSYLPGDSSYKYAYYNRFYELCKARLLEGVPDSYIYGEKGNFDFSALNDSLAGDSVGYQINRFYGNKLIEVIDIQEDLRMDSIDLSTACARMIDNSVYDQINMNTFNFIRASFDNMFFRYPNQAEFDIAYEMIENDKPGILFGKSAQNKGEYIDVLAHSTEFYEGVIKWMYRTYLARDPSASETYTMMSYFYFDHNYQKAQKVIMMTDEYANF